MSTPAVTGPSLAECLRAYTRVDEILQSAGTWVSDSSMASQMTDTLVQKSKAVVVGYLNHGKHHFRPHPNHIDTWLNEAMRKGYLRGAPVNLADFTGPLLAIPNHDQSRRTTSQTTQAQEQAPEGIEADHEGSLLDADGEEYSGDDYGEMRMRTNYQSAEEDYAAEEEYDETLGGGENFNEAEEEKLANMSDLEAVEEEEGKAAGEDQVRAKEEDVLVEEERVEEAEDGEEDESAADRGRTSMISGGIRKPRLSPPPQDESERKRKSPQLEDEECETHQEEETTKPRRKKPRPDPVTSGYPLYTIPCTMCSESKNKRTCYMVAAGNACFYCAKDRKRCTYARGWRGHRKSDNTQDRAAKEGKATLGQGLSADIVDESDDEMLVDDDRRDDNQQQRQDAAPSASKGSSLAKATTAETSTGRGQSSYGRRDSQIRVSSVSSVERNTPAPAIVSKHHDLVVPAYQGDADSMDIQATLTRLSEEKDDMQSDLLDVKTSLNIVRREMQDVMHLRAKVEGLSIQPAAVPNDSLPRIDLRAQQQSQSTAGASDIAKRVERVQQQLSSHEDRLVQLEKRLDAGRGTCESHQDVMGRVERLEKSVEHIAAAGNAIEVLSHNIPGLIANTIDAVMMRHQTAVGAHLQALFDNMGQSLVSKFDTMEQRMLESTSRAFTEARTNTHTDLAQMEAQIAAVALKLNQWGIGDRESMGQTKGVGGESLFRIDKHQATEASARKGWPDATLGVSAQTVDPSGSFVQGASGGFQADTSDRIFQVEGPPTSARSLHRNFPVPQRTSQVGLHPTSTRSLVGGEQTTAPLALSVSVQHPVEHRDSSTSATAMFPSISAREPLSTASAFQWPSTMVNQQSGGSDLASGAGDTPWSSANSTLTSLPSSYESHRSQTLSGSSAHQGQVQDNDDAGPRTRSDFTGMRGGRRGRGRGM